ncbi:glycosyltransferase family 17-domain-containing protein [Apiosordaria backusii]|uniref:Glycosyltransferase family 17-domain-containing protein n=1 Tax=Apiosordaria backusii TaxID=314023 RepID=A0AA40B7J8_9PEZI|nr:glycosyltransferase family 17-domain-containing protein [Apiosordaria backusii]
MSFELPVDREKPRCPYVAGFKKAVTPDTPHPPFGGSYKVSGPKPYESYVDIRNYTHTQHCIKHLEPDEAPKSSTPSKSPASGPSLVVDSVVRGGDEAGAQIVICHWENDSSAMKYIAKIYDPLYYKFEDAEIGLPTDVVWIAARDYSIEAAAYEELEAYEAKRQGDSGSIKGCYPEYFGSFSFDLKLVVGGVTYTRTLPLILIEYLDGSTMKEMIDDNQVPASDDARIHAFVCATKSHLKLGVAGVLQGDFAPRNIFFIGDLEIPKFRAAIFDFNIAKVLSRMNPPRTPPKINPISFVENPGWEVYFQQWLPKWFFTDEDRRKSELLRLWHRSFNPFEPSASTTKMGRLVPHVLKNAVPAPCLTMLTQLEIIGPIRFSNIQYYPEKLHEARRQPHITEKMALRTRRLWRYTKIAAILTTLYLLYDKLTFYTTNDTICRPHGWKPFVQSPSLPPRKVYDLTMINTELDWLEIRLNSTWSSVDYFVVVESPRTFTNLPKPLHLKSALSDPNSRLTPYKSKIIHHEITYPPSFSPKSTWNIEDFQRNAMLTQVFPLLSGAQSPSQNDVIVVSDIDEIPRPSTLNLLRQCHFPRRLTLSSRFYYYSFQFLHKGKEWPHPQATFYQGLANTILPNDLRIGDGPWPKKLFERETLRNAAWHCSSCFETMEEMLVKMKSFAHVSMNQEGFRDKKRMVERVREGRDLWDRPGEEYERVEGNEDLPGLLLMDGGQRERFGYLLDRDGEGAGFRDWEGE